MRLTNRSEYGLLALIYLARKKAGELSQANQIVETQKIPKRFLQQILHTLKQAKLIQTVRGKSGGYRLARPAEKISLAEVLRLFEGPLAPTTSVSENFYAPSPIEREPGLMKLMKEVQREVARKLEGCSLKDVI